MKIVSVNVGTPREVEWRGKTVLTAIFKSPVSGTVGVKSLNLEGDRQADLTSHGGEHKAIYGYPSEHYAYWKAQYPDPDLSWGGLGENLTTEGLLESEVRIQDRFRAGTAELEITQPRMPCFKLGIRLGRPDAVKRFEQALRPGFYFRVVREGRLAANDPLERIASNPEAPTVVSVVELSRAKDPDRAAVEIALALPHLGPEWRGRLSRHLR